MLRGDLLRLRPVQAEDLDALYSRLNDLEHRGSFFPLGLHSEPKFGRDFEKDGFWTTDEGMLLMIDANETRLSARSSSFPSPITSSDMSCHT